MVPGQMPCARTRVISTAPPLHRANIGIVTVSTSYLRSLDLTCNYFSVITIQIYRFPVLILIYSSFCLVGNHLCWRTKVTKLIQNTGHSNPRPMHEVPIIVLTTESPRSWSFRHKLLLMLGSEIRNPYTYLVLSRLSVICVTVRAVIDIRAIRAQ